MDTAKGESTRALVIRAVLVTIVMIVGLKLTMPHQSLVRQSATAVLAMGGLLAYVLYRRRQKAAE